MRADEQIVLTTCPRDCYDACGIAVIKQHGAITRVRGDKNNPVNLGALCGKCTLAYNGVLRDPAVRLTRPLRRAGPKGVGRFEPVSWDEALTTVAGRLRDVVRDHGPEAVAYAHYTGTVSRLAYSFPLRLFNHLGATEVEPDTICNMAGHVALQYTLGTSLVGFDPRTAKDAATIVVWGANPSACAPHTHNHWLPASPAKKIVIDPVRHQTARVADLHLQLLPGTDAALAFALLHVLRRDGLIDRAFIDRHVVGWNEVEATVEQCTAAWGERVTGVPAALIEQAARLYGSGPALLWLGQGMQRQPNGGNAFRACAMLPAATGNFGKPGAGLLYLNMDGGVRGIDDDYLAGTGLRTGKRPSVSHMDLAARLEDPGGVRALVCWNINPAASNPDQRRLRRALQRDDLFTVVCEQFQTDTADFADIVLPAASFLEFDDLVTSYFHLTIAPQSKAQDPLGESLPNQEIFRRLARVMGFTAPALFEPDRAVIDRLLAGTSWTRGFDELKRTGTVFVSPEPALQFESGAFPTPSGRIEIASSRAEADGHPRVPHPVADARSAAERLRLLSPASPWLMNDSFANDERVGRELGPAHVTLHPADAAARGLRAGDTALLANELGELTLEVRISDEVPPSVALSYKGRWPKREQQGANINFLTNSRKTDMGESTCVHATEVTVTRTSA